MPNIQKHPIRFVFLIVAVLAVTISSGCTWVKPSQQAEKVRVVPADRVADCTSLGTIKTNTTQNIAVVKRGGTKVKSELETLAKNEAAESGADTIVASSEIVDGRQTFTMYRCLN